MSMVPGSLLLTLSLIVVRASLAQVAANETTEPTSPAPLAAHGPNRQLGAVACMRHMMGDGNPLDLGGLADDVTALYDHLNL